jgi:hypothetical protein
MAYRRIFLLFIFLAALSAHAAELGDPRISSYKGQALVADIELSGLDDPAAPVQVRVANPDVYRGASINVPPILSALNLSVVRQGGKQFVHVTTSRPVDTDMLHLFLELGQGNQRDVRLATLWTAADPHPAPPPVAVVVPPPAPPPAPAPVPVPVTTPIAAPVTVVAASVPVSKPVPAPLHLAAVSTALPASLKPAPQATCSKASAASNACAVLDTKNVALQAKLVGLEDKIKLLQAALAPAKVAAATVAPAAEAHAASIIPPIAKIKPPPEPVPVLVMPKKAKPPAAKPSATPWLWIAVAAAIGLMALGSIVFLLLRRRKAKAVVPSAPKGPGIMAGVKNRLKARKASPVEPALES